MSNVLAIILIVEIGLVFVPMVVLSTFSTLILKAFVARIEAVEYKLRQIPLPVETDLKRSQECLHPNHPEACAYPEFVDDGEIHPDDDSYSIPENRDLRMFVSDGEIWNDGDDDDSYSIPENRDPRMTNSNGVPIARKSDVDSPE